MVTLGIPRENRISNMRRSKTSAQLKTNSQKRYSGPTRTSRFWNPSALRDELARSSLHTAQYGTTNRTPIRRRSIDCTYHIQIGKISDAADGIKNLRIIDEDTMERGRSVFPPISKKSLQNPRIQSAKSSSRSERGIERKINMNKPENLRLTNGHVITPSDAILSARTSTSDLCHGLPDFSNDTDMESRRMFSFGMVRTPNTPETQRMAPTRASRLKASSLHSRSSEGSCNSAAYRAKFASTRRLSLPVNPSLSVPGKSREFHKAIQEISRQTKDSNGGMKRSQTSASVMTLSDKCSTPPHSSSTNRDGSLSILPNHRCDSLQRIEEAPVEQVTPIFTVNEETKDEIDVGNDRIPRYINGATSTISDVFGMNMSIGDDSGIFKKHEQYPKSATVDFAITHQQSLNDEACSGQYDINANEISLHTKCSFTLGTETDGAEDEQSAKKKTAPELIECNLENDDKSVIDASVLDERDDDLCDTDFREKRIIEWIISTETGDKVDQEVHSVISPSPTNGSRETAITVIYDG